MANLYDEGDEGIAHDALAEGKSSMQLLWKGGKRSNWSDLTVAPQDLSLLRNTVSSQLENTDLFDNTNELLLRKLGIESQAYGSMDELLRQRENLLLDKERAFIEELGLEWGANLLSDLVVAHSD